MEQVLVFALGDELYGLEVKNIQEVVEAPVLHYIPRADEHFSGAINFHGSILPVLDLPAYLGFDSPARDPRIIVLVPELCSLALSATAIRRIRALDPEALLPSRGTSDTAYIRTVCNHDGEIINMLDTAPLLASLDETEKVTGGNDGA